MRRVRSFGSGRSARLGWAEGVLIVFLILPPALRIAWDSGPLRSWLGSAPVASSHDADLEARVAALLDANQRLRADLAALGETKRTIGEDEADRFLVLSADVLSISDPAADRDTLWVSFDGSRASAVPAAAVSGRRLIGRLIPSPAGFGLARVQTVADPLFRVRFRIASPTGSHTITGVLWGTGRRDGNGRPLLEVHHSSAESTIESGSAVVTAGNDGIFPPGLLIGDVVDGTEVGRSVEVRSAVPAGASGWGLERISIVIDRARREFAALSAAEEP